MKLCLKCNQWKDETQFQTYKGKPVSPCRACKNSQSKINYSQNITTRSIKNREYQRLLHKEHPEITRARDKKFYWMHTDKKQEYRDSHRENILSYHRLYYQEHKEELAIKSRRYRQNHPVEEKERHKQYEKKYPEKTLARVKRHEARRRGSLIIDLTAYDWKAIQNKYQDRCVYCGKTGIKLTQDHVIPPPRGSHTRDNIVPACQPCNASKGIKSIKQWKMTPYYLEYCSPFEYKELT